MDSIGKRTDRATAALNPTDSRGSRARFLGPALLGLLLAAASAVVPGTAFAVQRWEKRYKPTGVAAGYDVEQTSDGGYIVAGGGSMCALLMKLDSLGDTLWTRTYLPDDAWYSDFMGVVVTPDHGYVAAGTVDPDSNRTRKSDLGWGCVYVVRTDSRGDTIWTRRYRRIDIDARAMAQDIASAPHEGFATIGWQELPSGDSYNYLVRLDSMGDTIWTRVFDGRGAGGDDAAIERVRDKGFIFATQGLGIGDRHLSGRMVRVDSLGNEIWSRLYGNGGASEYILTAVDTTPDGGFAAAGYGTPSNPDHADFWLVRTNEMGETLWTRSYGLPLKGEVANGLCRNAGGGFVLVGCRIGYLVSDGTYMVGASPNGSFKWEVIGSPGARELMRVRQTSDGGYIAVGFDEDDASVLLVKTDSLGSSAVQSEPDERTEPALGMIAGPSIGNSHRFALRFSVLRPGSVTISVFDNTGRIVAKNVYRAGNPGWHEASLPADLAAGVYIARLRSGMQQASTRFAVVK